MARRSCKRVALRKKQAYRDGFEAKAPSRRVNLPEWRRGQKTAHNLSVSMEPESNDYR